MISYFIQFYACTNEWEKKSRKTEKNDLNEHNL